MYLLRDKNGKIIATVCNCNKNLTLQQYTIDTNICLVHNIFEGQRSLIEQSSTFKRVVQKEMR